MPTCCTLTQLLAFSVTACNRQGADHPTAVTQSPAQQNNANNTGAAEVAPDAACVGAAIGARGDLVAPQNVFAPGATVYLAVPSRDRRMGDRMDGFWLHQDGKSRKDEHSKIAGPFTAFEFKPTETCKYNVEVGVNDRPIGLVEFQVK